MAVLTKDEYFDRLRAVVGDDVSDDAVKLVEDFTDTYTDLEARASSDDTEALKEQLEKERASWAKLYKDRFFSSPTSVQAPQPTAREIEQERAETITVSDLFKKA